MAGQVQRHRGQGQVSRRACLFNSRSARLSHNPVGRSREIRSRERFHFHLTLDRLALLTLRKRRVKTASLRPVTNLPNFKIHERFKKENITCILRQRIGKQKFHNPLNLNFSSSILPGLEICKYRPCAILTLVVWYSLKTNLGHENYF